VNPIACPHCHKDYPEKYEGRYCPHCGAARPDVLGTPQPNVPSVGKKSPSPTRIKLPIFFAVLLAPALLTLLFAYINRAQGNEGISPGLAVGGGVGAGIACGIMLALRMGKSVGAKIALSVLLSVLFVFVCVMLSFFGCMIGGYQLSFH
jgi:hypothetical protein